METFQRIVKLGYTNFWRNRWLTLGATLLMTLTLIMISVSLVVSLIVRDLADTIRSKIDLTIYFRNDAVSEGDINALGDRVKLQNGVAEVTFTDKRAALTIWSVNFCRSELFWLSCSANVLASSDFSLMRRASAELA